MMKLVIAFVCALSCGALFAAPPTTESVERLLSLTGSQKMLDNMYQQIDGIMRSTMNQELAKNSKLTPADRERLQKSVDGFVKKSIDAYRQELSWDKMKQVLVPSYAETFSQEEVDGLIAFYQSPAGKAYVEKMPALLQKTMSQMQQIIGPLTQKIQAASQEFAKSAAQQSSAQSSTP